MKALHVIRHVIRHVNARRGHISLYKRLRGGYFSTKDTEYFYEIINTVMLWLFEERKKKPPYEPQNVLTHACQSPLTPCF